MQSSSCNSGNLRVNFLLNVLNMFWDINHDLFKTFLKELQLPNSYWVAIKVELCTFYSSRSTFNSSKTLYTRLSINLSWKVIMWISFKNSRLKDVSTLSFNLSLVSNFKRLCSVLSSKLSQSFKSSAHSSPKLQPLQDSALYSQKLKPQKSLNFVLQIAFSLRFCRLVHSAQFQSPTKFQIQCTLKLEDTAPVKIDSILLKSWNSKLDAICLWYSVWSENLQVLMPCITS